MCSSIAYIPTNLRAEWCAPYAIKDGTFGAVEMMLAQDVDAIFGLICSAGSPRAFTQVAFVGGKLLGRLSVDRAGLGMFEVFGRTGPPTLGGPPFWTVKIPYKLTCQFERL